MFRKLASFALFAPLVAALTLDPPKGTWYSQQSVTISWSAQPSDPLFSIYLINEAFHDNFGIANNVRPTDGQITLTLPVLVPRDGYTLHAVNVGDVNDVYSSTGVFSIAPNPSTTSSSTSGSTSGTGTSTGTSTGLTTRTTASTSTGLATTLTTPATTLTGTTTRPATTGATTNTPFNAAATFKTNNHVTALAAVAFSVVAGAAVFAL